MDIIKALLRRLSWSLLLYWGLLFGMLWALTELADTVYDKGGFFFDAPILSWFYKLLNPTLTSLALFASTIGGVGAMSGVAVLVVYLSCGACRTARRFFSASAWAARPSSWS